MSVKPPEKAVPVDAAKQREVLESVAERLETITVRYYRQMTVDHIRLLKKAVSLLNGKVKHGRRG
jgi:hypothetical protein